MSKIEKLYRREIKRIVIPGLFVLVGAWLVVSAILLYLAGYN
jgi:hypothetical protein